jgi:alpha-beta hydrolase superfamily lysophospholipase
MFTGNDFWKNYMVQWFGKELISKWENNVQIEIIKSNNRNIHLEIYANSDKNSPTIIFSHGIAGYARVLLPFIFPLFEKGYNFVVPDLQGYGYNEGLKGDFEWNAHVQNLVDTVEYAKAKFNGKIIIGGASMGGPLAYAASCVIPEKIDALICWCLWDFSDREFMLKETNTGRFTYILLPLFKILSKLIGNLRIKTYSLISYDTLTSSSEFNNLLKNDPQAGTLITIKGAVSLVTQSKPKIIHNNYNIPTLVIQPGEDRMTPKYYIKKTFDNIGSAKKRYIELEKTCHFPIENKYYEIWALEVDKFIKEL